MTTYKVTMFNLRSRSRIVLKLMSAKYLLIIGACCIATQLPLSRPAHAEASVNPDFVATLLDNSQIELQTDSMQRPLLLKFWATWCGTCMQEMPDFARLHQRYGQSVEMVAVNVAVDDPIDCVRRTVDELSLKISVAYDESGTLWNQFDVIGTPTYVLIGTNGDVIHRSSGHDENLEAEIAIAAKADDRTKVDEL